MKTESTSLTCFLESLIYITAKCFPSLVTSANLRKVPTAAGPAGSEHPPPLVVLFSLPGSLGRSLPSSNVLPPFPIRFQQATKRKKKRPERFSLTRALITFELLGREEEASHSGQPSASQYLCLFLEKGNYIPCAVHVANMMNLGDWG